VRARGGDRCSGWIGVTTRPKRPALIRRPDVPDRLARHSRGSPRISSEPPLPVSTANRSSSV
jgi:hypothetical protein